MEPIYIPDINRLNHFASTYIDVLHGISTSFEPMYDYAAQAGIIDISHEKGVQKIIDALLHLPITNMPNLDNLVDLVGQTLAYSLEKDHVTSVYEPYGPNTSRFVGKFSKLTAGLLRQNTKCSSHTFDKESVARYLKIQETMVEKMNQHKKLSYKLQKQQNKYWEARDKVKKYELCVETATSALVLMMKKGQRSKSRVKAIEGLKRTLKDKHQILTKVNTKYEKIQKEEKELRQSIEKLQHDLVADVKTRLTSTLQETLSSILRIISNGLQFKECQRSLEILNTATGFDIKDTVESISNKYQVKMGGKS